MHLISRIRAFRFSSPGGFPITALILPVLAGMAIAAGDDTRVIRPVRDDALLLNPGKGYVQYYEPDNTNTDAYIGIGYNRCYWADLEPVEGQFKWEIIDDTIKQFKAHGKKTGYRVMNAGTGMGKISGTPQWVFDAGAVPLDVPDETSPTGKHRVPKDWADPIFLKKMHNYIQALGKRYDGNPDIAFFDMGGYGNWGEGHTGGLPGSQWTPGEVFKPAYLQPYIDAFPHTQLILLWGGATDGVWDWCINRNIGVRRDGILSEWSDGTECAKALGHAPAVYEDNNNYTHMKKAGTWPGNQWVTDYLRGRPSYWQFDANYLKDDPVFYKNLGNRIGYHFILQEATIPTHIKAGRPFTITWKWLNDGVAPLYEPCQVAIALLDDKDQVVQQQWLTASQPAKWLPDASTTETLSVNFPNIPPETRKLAVGLFLERSNTVPDYRLGIQGRTTQGWYVLYNIPK
jgi:hypothetical protein